MLLDYDNIINSGERNKTEKPRNAATLLKYQLQQTQLRR